MRRGTFIYLRSSKMCLIVIPALIIVISTAYASTKFIKHASLLEILSGSSLIIGLATLGFCLPLYRP